MQEDLQVERESAVLDPEVLRRAMEDPGGMPVVINGVPEAGAQTEEDKGSGIKSAVFHFLPEHWQLTLFVVGVAQPEPACRQHPVAAAGGLQAVVIGVDNVM